MKRFNKSYLLIVLMASLAFSAQTVNAAPSLIDTYLGEAYEGGSKESEDKIIKELAALSLRSLKERHSKSPVPRAVHAKSHGCLFGTLQVENSDLPDDLKVGVFKANSTNKIILRYSSNNKDRNLKDTKPDIRGLGLKVMNVNGEEGKSQDFLFLASKTIFFQNNAFYVEFLKRLFKSDSKAGGFLLRKNVRGALSVGKDMFLTALKYKNPLDIPFFSAVPYRLGVRFDDSGYENEARRAVKYRITRSSCTDDKKIKDPRQFGKSTPNYLRANLSEVIENNDACLILSVQIRDQKDKDKYPVEDSSIKWKIDYIDVGKIVIHRQVFDSPEMNSFCENLKFSPWITLPEHFPLGRTNRARKEIYEVISAHRHSVNGVDNYREPTDFSISQD